MLSIFFKLNYNRRTSLALKVATLELLESVEEHSYNKSNEVYSAR